MWLAPHKNQDRLSSLPISASSSAEWNLRSQIPQKDSLERLSYVFYFVIPTCVSA